MHRAPWDGESPSFLPGRVSPLALSLRVKGGLPCFQKQGEAEEFSDLQVSSSFLAVPPGSPTPRVRDVSLGITYQPFGGHQKSPNGVHCSGEGQMSLPYQWG